MEKELNGFLILSYILLLNVWIYVVWLYWWIWYSGIAGTIEFCKDLRSDLPHTGILTVGSWEEILYYIIIYYLIWWNIIPLNKKVFSSPLEVILCTLSLETKRKGFVGSLKSPLSLVWGQNSGKKSSLCLVWVMEPKVS